MVQAPHRSVEEETQVAGPSEERAEEGKKIDSQAQQQASPCQGTAEQAVPSEREPQAQW